MDIHTCRVTLKHQSIVTTYCNSYEQGGWCPLADHLVEATRTIVPATIVFATITNCLVHGATILPGWELVWLGFDVYTWTQEYRPQNGPPPSMDATESRSPTTFEITARSLNSSGFWFNAASFEQSSDCFLPKVLCFWSTATEAYLWNKTGRIHHHRWLLLKKNEIVALCFLCLLLRDRLPCLFVCP